MGIRNQSKKQKYHHQDTKDTKDTKKAK